jgi:plasmid stabilization system protein ParE
MRRYRFAPSAAQALDRQIEYLISVHAPRAARLLEQRVRTYISHTLCRFPFAGTHIPERDIYESWIPGRRLVVWYKVYDSEIIIAMIWNTSQDRKTGDENES